MPVEESDSGSTWLHLPSYEIEGLYMASVGIPLANFTMGCGTGSPKQPEAHWEEGKNVQDSGRDVAQSVSEKYVVLISSNFVLFKNLKLWYTCAHTFRVFCQPWTPFLFATLALEYLPVTLEI